MALTDHSVLSVRLSASVRRKLLCSGFATIEDFDGFHGELENASSIGDPSNVLDMVKQYKGRVDGSQTNSQVSPVGRIANTVAFESASFLLKNKLQNVRHIVSFSSTVDQLLGGGFPLGGITEIAGEAGLGKTQFCFQLCVDVQIPKHLGGIEGEAVFLDVEGTFTPQRVEQIAAATVEHCHRIGSPTDSTQSSNFTVKDILSHIYFFRCCDSVQLLAAVHQLKDFLKSHPHVRLIIIDSIAQSFRGEEDYRSRSKVLSNLGGCLSSFVSEFDVAVVMTNQITSSFASGGVSYNIPALGSKWSHFATHKLMLCRKDSERWLYQYKSPDQIDGAVPYCITADGIRDL